MSSWDYSDTSNSCNRFVLYPANKDDSLDVSHAFSFDITVSCGMDTITVGTVRRVMSLHASVTHTWENLTENANAYVSDAEGSSFLYELEPGDIIGLIGGSTSAKWVDRIYPSNNPPETFRAYYNSTWSGSYTDEFTYDIADIRMVDPQRRIVYWNRTRYHVTANATSSSPVGWAEYRVSDEGSKTMWCDAVGFRGVIVHTEKIVTERLWIAGNEYELSVEQSAYDTPYNIPAIIYPAWLPLRYWYNISEYFDTPGDDKGDGYCWSTPLWMFHDDTELKYRFSWIDTMVKTLQQDAGYTIAEGNGFTSPVNTQTYTLNPNCPASVAISRAIDPASIDMRCLVIATPTTTKIGTIRYGNDTVGIALVDLASEVDEQYQGDTPCYPVCPM